MGRKRKRANNKEGSTRRESFQRLFDNGTGAREAGWNPRVGKSVSEKQF